MRRDSTGLKKQPNHKGAPRPWQPHSVLIVQNELVNYAGSEMITLELAEYFTAQGAQVTVFTNWLDYPIKRDFAKLRNVQIVTTDQVLTTDYDLIWVHHQALPVSLIQAILSGALQARVVYHHMSPYHPLESPFSGVIEQQLADVIVCNSEETRTTLVQSGYKILGQRSAVLYNPAPDYFAGAKRRKRNTLQRVLVVTNHLPAELMAAIQILQEQGIQVTTKGIHSDGGSRVTPAILRAYDVVISIGKTVQYALVAGVPAYCYDHYGGPGYLTADNFQTAMHYNFSGRGFSAKTAQDIVRELKNDYPAAADVFAALCVQYATDFLLSKRMAGVLAMCASRQRHKPSLMPLELAAYSSSQQLIRSQHLEKRKLMQEASATTKALANSQAALSDAMAERERLRVQLTNVSQVLHEVYNSQSWKLTRLLRKANTALAEIRKSRHNT